MEENNFFLGLNKHRVTKASEKFRLFICIFFTLAEDRVKWVVSGPCYFTFLKSLQVFIGQVLQETNACNPQFGHYIFWVIQNGTRGKQRSNSLNGNIRCLLRGIFPSACPTYNYGKLRYKKFQHLIIYNEVLSQSLNLGAVHCRLPASETWVRSLDIPCGICGVVCYLTTLEYIEHR
jgi:hypothetical protein